MMLTMRRNSFTDSGIFGVLLDEAFNVVAYTAEHSYDKAPKLPDGNYTCLAGQHALSNGVPFQTFEIIGVPGHTGILFHCGNDPQIDSHGCVLLGTTIDGSRLNDSRVAFNKFMDLVADLESFILSVKS